MSVSPDKRILKWTILLLPWLLVIVLATGWGIATWTPGYLETLIPKLAKDMGLPLEEFHIRDAGLFSADVGPVRLGSKKDGLRLGNVHVSYTPLSLKKGRVNQVVLDGVSLNCSYNDQTLTLPVLDLLPPSNNTPAATKDTLPVLPFDSMIIKDSVLLCNLNGKSLSIPFSATITPGKTIHFSGLLQPRDQRIALSAELGPSRNDLSLKLAATDLLLGALGDFMPIPASGNMDLDLTAKLDLSQPDTLVSDIQIAIRNTDLSTLGIALADGEQFSARATITGRTAAFSMAPIAIAAPYPATITIAQGHASSSSLTATASIAAAGITMPVDFKANQQGDLWEIALTSTNPEAMTIKTKGRTIRLAGLDWSLAGKAGAGMADVLLTGSTKGASLGNTGMRTGATKVTLPLAWPAPKLHTPGKLKVTGLRFDKHKLGTISANVRQQSMGLTFGGTLYTELLPSLRIPFSGQTSMENKQATLKFDIRKYSLPEDFDPSSLVANMKGIKLSGDLAADGGVNISENGIESRLGLFFTGGTLSLVESGTTISGIRLFLESPDLLDFRSAPAQMFAFDSLTSGGIKVEKGLVTFQIEPRNVVLVERLGFDWCGGHVASRAFRVVPGHNEYDVTLFCSQLRLSDILAQLGLADAKGEAALSGELPVTWKKGKISFNNGFLHSTPGQGGIIQVEAMDDLINAIPRGTPQRGQLELAQAAIRNYEYKWVRIKADTVGEDLLVRMSLDGKPVGTLPFVYKREFGGFAKITGDIKGSNFQGLKLDVNFSLPLDRILLYKDIIGMIE
jgi:hypothetical protein